MNREDLYKVVEDAIRNMSNDDIVALYNEYDERGGDTRVYENDDDSLDMVFEGETPSAIVRMVCDPSRDYNFQDRYFFFDGYGYPVSFSGVLSDKSPIYPPEIAEYIVDNDDALYNDEIRAILDSADNEDEFEESLKRRNRRYKR